ncbi:MAG: nucleotide sugar dehydrogenase [Actinomycetia bacterium]|nr:nucleotide sugar dehydrogenase [Actinomycetes bacterium]
MTTNNAAERFANEPFTCAVIGLGYVGLPLAITITNAGLDVIGFDVSDRVVNQLSDGRSNTVDVTDAQLSEALESRLRVTTDPTELAKADAVFICVPSPLGIHREPDLSYIRSAAETLGAYVRPGMFVSLESTTYPGTTTEVLVPALTASGLAIDTDLFVAFSPERVSPGGDLELNAIPKVVGGVSAASSEVGAAVYGRFIDTVHAVGSSEVAEFTKLLENTYRAVNIALVNELAQFADRIGVDIWEAIDAAATKPFGFQAFYPGPGVGGHCIPLDPQYLAWRAREVGSSLSFIDTAERINGGMPKYVAQRAIELLNEQAKSVRGSKILAVGIAYKPDVADDRESASIEVLNELRSSGADVHVVDPNFDAAHIEARGFRPATEPFTADFDLAIVLTHHSAVDYSAVAKAAPLVLDTRNAYATLATRLDNVRVL